MGTILLIILVVMLIGSAPVYPYSRDWGYRPTGIVGLLVVVMLVLLLMGTVPWGFGPGPAPVAVR
jgi:hypothetical protein